MKSKLLADLHVWSLSGERLALTAHVRVTDINHHEVNP